MTGDPRPARPRKTPCAPSCPYRRDCPSGMWAAEEYARLASYDGTTGEQAQAGATAVFLCHQGTGEICAGYAAVHGDEHSLALRMAAARGGTGVDVEAVLAYTTTVPLWGSGTEAAEHGIRDLAEPGEASRRAREKIAAVRRYRGQPVRYISPLSETAGLMAAGSPEPAQNRVAGLRIVLEHLGRLSEIGGRQYIDAPCVREMYITYRELLEAGSDGHGRDSQAQHQHPGPPSGVSPDGPQSARRTAEMVTIDMALLPPSVQRQITTGLADGDTIVLTKAGEPVATVSRPPQPPATFGGSLMGALRRES